MTITVREALDMGNPNNIGDLLRAVKLGTALTQLQRRVLRHQTAVAVGATYSEIVLPDWCKASRVLRGHARHTTATAAGELTVHAWGGNAGSGEISLTSKGNIQVLTSDGYSGIDVEYEPAYGQVVSAVLPCIPSTGLCVLPAALFPNPFMLLEAESLVGTVTGVFAVAFPTDTHTTTLTAMLNLAQDTVGVRIADAVTSLRVKVLCQAEVDPQALLVANVP